MQPCSQLLVQVLDTKMEVLGVPVLLRCCSSRRTGGLSGRVSTQWPSGASSHASVPPPPSPPRGAPCSLPSAHPFLLLLLWGDSGLNSCKVASLKLLWVPMCLGDLCRITGNYTCGKFWLGMAG